MILKCKLVYCDGLQDEPEGQPSDDDDDEQSSSDDDDNSWIKEVQQQHRYKCCFYTLSCLTAKLNILH